MALIEWQERFRIGIESVDLEDVGTGQSRRIPLKGN